MRVLAARLDSLGDVLLTGPAVRALARASEHLTFLTSSGAAEGARLLPGVDHVLTYDAPWVLADPPAVEQSGVDRLLRAVAATAPDRAVVFTSFHQSPLPAALLLRLAGVEQIAAICEDYPGSLLDVRHRVGPDVHEVERNVSLVEAAGFRPGDDLRLAVELGSHRPPRLLDRLPDRFVVVHPGSSAPARTASPAQWVDISRALVAAGHHVVVTGGPGESRVVRIVSRSCRHGTTAVDGALSVAELGHLLATADVVVCGNTGPAHLAAAVGTAVVSVFPPTVPAERWRPWGVPSILLGNQDIACRGCRARRCPYGDGLGQPCLAGVGPADVVSAVDWLVELGRDVPVAS